MHSENELFEMIDSALFQLVDELRMLRKLSATSPALKGFHRDLTALKERLIVEAKMIRVKIGLKNVRTLFDGGDRFEFSIEIPDGSSLSYEVHHAIKSCAELCRTLEEYFRFFGQTQIELSFKKMRFEFYDYERHATATLGLPRKRVDVDEETPDNLLPKTPVGTALTKCPLYFILDESLCDRRDPLKLAFNAVAGGAKLMQLRFKKLSSRQLLDLARKVMSVCSENNCMLFLNDRPDIAILSGATGVHLGDNDLSLAEARQLGSSLMVGVTAPTKSAALEAQAAGAAYVGVGAIFRSKTKPRKTVVGVRRISTISKAVDIPVIGIGGITLENYGKCLDAGAAGVCSIGSFHSRRSTKNLVAQFNRAKKASQKQPRRK